MIRNGIQGAIGLARRASEDLGNIDAANLQGDIGNLYSWLFDPQRDKGAAFKNRVAGKR